mgnify:CR=1 FL=1|tara:strand:+ start:1426 stop:2211 length:786 start_codon:yes stop_codon:yes gene_type:complete
MLNNKKWLSILLTTSAVLMFMSTSVKSDELYVEEEPYHNTHLTLSKILKDVYVLSGSVGEGDCDRISPLFPAEGHFTVILESPGGSLIEGMCLSKALKDLDVTTVVREHSLISKDGKVLYNAGHNTAVSDSLAKAGEPRVVICASACSLLFLGGDNRMLLGTVYLGIHSPKSSTHLQSPAEIEAAAFAVAASLLKFLKYDLLVDGDDLRRFFITVPAATMYYLNPVHFKQAPWLIPLATLYVDFFGFNSNPPRERVEQGDN